MQLRLLILPIALVLSLWLYYPTSNYGVVTDYLGWLNKYREGNWCDVLHCFNYPGLHQVFHFFNYLIYRLTLADQFSLYLIFSLTHGLVSYSVYRTVRRFGEWMKWESAGTASFFVGVLFLMSPYQVEPVTWKACYHYLMITGFMCVSLVYLIRYFQQERSLFLGLHLLFFAFSLGTIELGLILPGIFGVVYLAYYWRHKNQSIFIKGVKISFVHLLFLIIYFLLTKAMIGSYVGHYGAEKHLTFDPFVLSSTASKYIIKYIAFTHYLSFQPRYDLYAWLSNSMKGLTVLLPYMGLIFFSIWKGRRDTGWIVIGVGLLGFLIALLPVLNLYFMNLHPYENDRYGYLASAFIYIAIIGLIYKFVYPYKYWASMAYITLALYFTVKTVNDVHNAGLIINGLVDDFSFQNKERIIIGGVPENYNGVYMLRDLDDKGLGLVESLDWIGGKKITSNINVLCKYNVMDTLRHLDMKMLDTTTVQVWNIKGGSWFWRKGVGMQGYNKEGVEVTMKDGHFNAVILDVPKETLFIYPVGNTWKEVTRK